MKTNLWQQQNQQNRQNRLWSPIPLFELIMLVRYYYYYYHYLFVGGIFFSYLEYMENAIDLSKSRLGLVT